jgi:predicted nucleic acid-binding protein
MAEQRLIICNTSPIINLAETGLLELFSLFQGVVCISPAVRDELRAKSGLFPLAAMAADSGQFSLLAPKNALLVRSFAASLHRGEAECLALAMEHPGSLLVLDDLSARANASANQLPFTGTLGILAAAKARGRLAALEPVLHELRLRARFWISPGLERFILEEAGEAD